MVSFSDLKDKEAEYQFYGLATTAITDALAKSFYAIPAIATCKTLDCLKNLPADQIIAAQEQLVQTAPFTIPGVPLGERKSMLSTPCRY
jgi:hypothetical protein